jgi:hypothetical protein
LKRKVLQETKELWSEKGERKTETQIHQQSTLFSISTPMLTLFLKSDDAIVSRTIELLYP